MRWPWAHSAVASARLPAIRETVDLGERQRMRSAKILDAGVAGIYARGRTLHRKRTSCARVVLGAAGQRLSIQYKMGIGDAVHAPSSAGPRR